METIEKKPMNKQELIQAFEKAKTQTRGQAARVIDMLVGVRSDPFAKQKQDKKKLQEGFSPEPDVESEGKLDES